MLRGSNRVPRHCPLTTHRISVPTSSRFFDHSSCSLYRKIDKALALFLRTQSSILKQLSHTPLDSENTARVTMGNKQSKQDSTPEASTAMPPPPLPGHPSRTNSIPKLDTDFLLQPPDESSIRHRWLQLNNLIDSHVQTFYSNINNIDVIATREKIQEVLFVSGIVEGTKDVDNLTELLYVPEHRKLGLRISIARAVVASIDFQNGRHETTSLDNQVVQLMSRFKTLRPDRSPEEEAALAHWRMITAFFLAPESKHSRADSSGEIPCVNILINFLGLFKRHSDNAQPGGSEQERNNANTDEDWEGSIRTIAVQAISIGEKLFCHPSTWTFRWCPHRREAPREASQIVLFPALVEDALSSSRSSSKRRHNTIQAADVSPAFVFSPDGVVIPAPEQQPDPIPVPASPSRSQGSASSRPPSVASGGGGSGGSRHSSNQVILNRSGRRSYFDDVNQNHYVTVNGDLAYAPVPTSGTDVNIVILPRRPSASRTGSGTLVAPVVYETRRPIIVTQSPESHSRRSRRPHSANRIYVGEDSDDMERPRRRDSGNRYRSTA